MAKKTKKSFAREGGPIREPIRESIREEEGEFDASLFQYTPYEARDQLHIDADLLRMVRDEYGYALQWVAETVLGQAQEESLVARRQNGFEFVQRGNFGSALDHLCDREGVVRKGGLVLMGRPYQIDEIAKSYEKKQAKQAISTMRKKHAEEGVDVPMPGGGKHKSALAQNRHRTEYNAIPEE